MKYTYLYCVFLILLLLINVKCIPKRGNEPWTLILCKFADLSHYEPKTPEYFKQWLSGPDNDSIENYFGQVSNGVYTIEKSNVVGWITLPYTQKDVLKMANADALAPIGSFSSFEYFDKIKEVCVDIASKNGYKLNRQKITVINSGTTAVYGKNNGVLLTPQLMFSSVLTHEMVHSFFIGHSYSDRRIKIFPYALHGEYDDRYDLQSTANAYMHRSMFGMSGPGLNGAHLDFLGWLPMDRMLYFGRDGRQNYTIRLSSLSIPHNTTQGWLLIMIPYDRNNPRNFYTVELRTPQRYDRGIRQPSVLIHRVQRSGSSYYSVLISQSKYFYELTEGTEWVTFIEPDLNNYFQSIKVSVRRIYTTDADVNVVSTFNPFVCRYGEIQKSVLNTVYNLETVCIKNNKAGEIVTETDLKRQYYYNNFFSLRLTFGANECKEGYVWRAIDEYDYVCVLPERQELARQQSELQPDRLQIVTSDSRESRSILENDSDYNSTRITKNDENPLSEDKSTNLACVHPYVKRNAFYGDNVCVTVDEQISTLNENFNSTNLWRYYEFFNGVDTVGP